MRRSVWLVASILTVATAGCSPRQQTQPAPPAAAAPPIQPAAAAAPEPAPAAAPAALPEAPPAPAAEAVHFSPADYGARERRIAALISNAESRDTLGETPRIAAQGRAERQRCSTKACIEHSYAAEEAWLRKWEGSSDIR